MNISHMKYAVAVAEAGSVSRAAEQLLVSAPNLSRDIRNLEEELGINIKVLDYSEHALTSGSGAQAASYIHMMDQDRKRVTYGVGISSNITRASLRGIFSAVNRLYGDN